jgi:hypothetical protein
MVNPFPLNPGHLAMLLNHPQKLEETEKVNPILQNPALATVLNHPQKVEETEKVNPIL